MLAAGGQAILSDGRREDDEHNPRGYLEYEPVKNLRHDNSWLAIARGKAVKIITQLLAVAADAIPLTGSYMSSAISTKFYFRSVACSPTGQCCGANLRQQLRRTFAAQANRIRTLARCQPNVTLRTVNYRRTDQRAIRVGGGRSPNFSAADSMCRPWPQPSIRHSIARAHDACHRRQRRGQESTHASAEIADVDGSGICLANGSSSKNSPM